jgi:hypothetical protein
MRTLAEDAQDSKVRAMMLRIAATYDGLARNADDRAAENSIMFRVVSPDDKTSAGAAVGLVDGPQECAAPRPVREALGEDFSNNA